MTRNGLVVSGEKAGGEKEALSQQKPAVTTFEYALTGQPGSPYAFEMDCSAYALSPSCSTVPENSSTDSIHGRDLTCHEDHAGRLHVYRRLQR